MHKSRIPATECNSCMQFIGTLPVISLDELEIGVYFMQICLTRFEPKMCNIYDILEQNNGGQTNNYLEHYNRCLNEQFANAHPNFFGFIARIKNAELDYTI
ncbi:hypothetical protein MXB_1375 [Myxobolus squamalis]|nr:hypothetical protein MXB_1375 [Myxobolus squamalis]